MLAFSNHTTVKTACYCSSVRICRSKSSNHRNSIGENLIWMWKVIVLKCLYEKSFTVTPRISYFSSTSCTFLKSTGVQLTQHPVDIKPKWKQTLYTVSEHGLFHIACQVACTMRCMCSACKCELPMFCLLPTLRDCFSGVNYVWCQP